MNNRRSFLRDCLLGLAVSLVPRILQPILPEFIEEEMVDIPIKFHYAHYDTENKRVYVTWEPTSAKMFSLRLPKKQAEIFLAKKQNQQ